MRKWEGGKVGRSEGEKVGRWEGAGGRQRIKMRMREFRISDFGFGIGYCE